jgi:stage II sporulation protein GA (sporulation sigma-E factor processing peptidase)
MYVEDLLALNLLMNGFLLYLAACLTGRKIKGGRLLAGSLVTALYSLAAYLPASVIFFSWAGKIIVSILAVLLTFRPRRAIETIRLCAAFVFTTFFVAGTIFSFYFFAGGQPVIRGGIFYLSLPQPGLLFKGSVAAFLLFAGICFYSIRQRKRQGLCYQLQVFDGDKKITVPALLDTGNQLRDPLTGSPLCVASYRILRVLLPQKLQEAYERGSDPVSALGEIPDSTAARFGVVPFRSLESSGVLVTYRPTLVVLEGNGYREERNDLSFALTSKPLQLENEAEVLLHPQIFNFSGGGDD